MNWKQYVYVIIYIYTMPTIHIDICKKNDTNSNTKMNKHFHDKWKQSVLEN